jgi:hypothetical protein
MSSIDECGEPGDIRLATNRRRVSDMMKMPPRFDLRFRFLGWLVTIKVRRL